MLCTLAFAYCVVVSCKFSFQLQLNLNGTQTPALCVVEKIQFDLLLISIHLKCEITTVYNTLTLQMFRFMKSTNLERERIRMAACKMHQKLKPSFHYDGITKQNMMDGHVCMQRVWNINKMSWRASHTRRKNWGRVEISNKYDEENGWWRGREMPNKDMKAQKREAEREPEWKCWIKQKSCYLVDDDAAIVATSCIMQSKMETYATTST